MSISNNGAAALVVENISKTYRVPNIPKQATVKDLVLRRTRREGTTGIVDALSDISFSLEHGGVLGIVGSNGSGKTTLLRVIAGVCHPDKGRVSVKGSMAPILAIGAGFHPDLTGRESARLGLFMLGLGPKDVAKHLGSVLDFSEIAEFADLPTRTYSAGMLFKLAFSVAVCVDPDILILDEVLSVGDARYSEKSLARIDSFKQRGKTVVVTTHELRFVEDWCTSAIWLHEGRIAASGEPAAVVAAYRDLALATA